MKSSFLRPLLMH